MIPFWYGTYLIFFGKNFNAHHNLMISCPHVEGSRLKYSVTHSLYWKRVERPPWPYIKDSGKHLGHPMTDCGESQSGLGKSRKPT